MKAYTLGIPYWCEFVEYVNKHYHGKAKKNILYGVRRIYTEFGNPLGVTEEEIRQQYWDKSPNVRRILLKSHRIYIKFVKEELEKSYQSLHSPFQYSFYEGVRA